MQPVEGVAGLRSLGMATNVRIRNPFSTLPYDERDFQITPGMRAVSTDIDRAARVDPIQDEIGRLTKRRTDLVRVHTSAENLRDAFVSKYGTDFFETEVDPSDVAKSRLKKDQSGNPIPIPGETLFKLRLDDGPEAKERVRRLETNYRAWRGTWDRISSQLQRTTDARTQVENEIGRLAAQRQKRLGLDLGGNLGISQSQENRGAESLQSPETDAGNVPQDGAKPESPAGDQPRSNGFAMRVAPDGSARTASGLVDPTNSVIRTFASQEEALAFHKGRQSPDQTVGGAPVQPGSPGAQPPPVSVVTPPAGPTPAQLIKIHRDMKTAEDVAKMETTSPELRKGLEQKAERLRGMLVRGMAALPSDGLRQRVIDITRDPTTGELVKNFLGRTAEGAGSTLVDVAEFVTRQTVGRAQTPQQQAKFEEFYNEARAEAASWGLSGVPKEVAAKMSEHWSSMLGQGLGSTAAFLVPTTGALRIGQLMGVSAKTLKVLAVVTPGLVGGAATSNSMRREAEANFEEMVKAGELTPEEAAKGAAQAEFIGFLAGMTESASPMGRWSKKIAGVPAGQTLLKKLAQHFEVGGMTAVTKWLRGNGRRLLVDVASEAGEEAFQELAQGYIGNLAARGDLGNQAFDPDRHLGEGLAGGAATGGAVGALVSAVLGGFSGTDVQRQKRIAAAMKRGAKTARAQPPAAPTPGATPRSTPAKPVTPTAPATPAKATTDDDEAAPAPKRWTFTDATGRTVTVEGTGLKDAKAKLPKDFTPDFKIPVRQEDIPVPPKPKTLPPEWKVTVQKAEGTVPGYVQVTMVDESGKSLGSITPEQLAEQGYEVPNFSGMETGNYTAGDIASGKIAPTVEAVPETLPDEDDSDAVEQAGAVLQRFDDGDIDTASSLADEIDTIAAEHEGAVGAKLYRAVEKYRAEVQQDMDEFGGRGDADQYEAAFVDEVRSTLSQPSAIPGSVGTNPDTVPITPQVSAVAGNPSTQASLPAIARGENNPARFVKVVGDAARLTKGRHGKHLGFLVDFARRLHKASPAAFEMMEVRALSQEDWDAEKSLSTRTPDSAAAYDQNANVLYVNFDKVNSENVASVIVHEGGHFAEKFYLGEDFTQREWEKLTDDQRAAAFTQYAGREDAGTNTRDLKANKQARSEWVAMQFARVVRGDTEGMSKGIKARLERFLRDVRELVTKWIGDGKLTTKELDAKIVEMLGYAEGGKAVKSKPKAQKPAKSKVDFPVTTPQAAAAQEAPASEAVSTAPEVAPAVAPTTEPTVAPPAEQAAEGPTVAPTAAQERKVSKMADKKALRVQKEFLLDAVRRAIVTAPDEVVMSAEGAADVALPLKGDGTPGGITAADRNRMELFKKYGLNPKLSEIADIEMAIRSAHAEHLTIEVPDDGTFRIPNSKPALAAFAKEVTKGFGKGLEARTPTRPSTTSPAITPLAKKPGAEDITEAVGIAQSTDETRYVLNRVIKDGKFTIATDGRRLVVALGGEGESLNKKGEVMRKDGAGVLKIGTTDKTGKTTYDTVRYPNWRQVVPKDFIKLTDSGFKVDTKAGSINTEVDAGETLRIVRLASHVASEKSNSVVIHGLPDGKIGFSAQSPDFGDYYSEGVLDLPQKHPMVAVDAGYMIDALTQARKMGAEKVRIIVKDENSPIIFSDGKRFFNVTMPVRLSGPPLSATPAPSASAESPDADEATVQEPAPAKEEQAGEITDFGEKIAGARKELWGQWGRAMREDLPADAESITLARNFPEPNYEAAIKAGASVENLATIAALRDLVPAKPRTPHKLSRWAALVRNLHSVSRQIVDGNFALDAESVDALIRKVEPDGGTITSKVSLYRKLGYPLFTKADDWNIRTAAFSVFNGVKFDSMRDVTFAEKDRRTVYELSSENTDSAAAYDEVVEKLRQHLEAQPDEAKPTETKFALYQDRGTGEVFIGKRGANGVVRIKAGFKEVSEARAFLNDNHAELEKKWAEMKVPPELRRAANNPREGAARRKGDVTPQVFEDTFGFRGVQFGNYVEGGRRQADLNEAFDAFVDMAEAIGVPPKALSLDGSLGLAFGARGGGKHVAHYEPGQVVINITKTRGPGSMAHEWFHGLDNYFARLEVTGDTVAKPLDAFATRAFSPAGAARPRNVRQEVWEAFRKIRDALADGPFAVRSDELDATRSKAYYGTTIEKAARAFEAYIDERLALKGISNDYLVNINKAETRPYPSKEEMDAGIRAAFDNLFNVLEVRTESRSGAMLGTPSDGESIVDPTEPARFQFRDAAAGEYLESDERYVREFEALGNKGRGSDAIRLTLQSPDIAREPADGSAGSVVGQDGSGRELGGLDTFRRRLQRAFGKRILFVRSSAPVEWGAMTARNRANIILVNVDARAPFEALVGHEFAHNIKAQNRSLWDGMRDVIARVAGPIPAEYQSRKNAEGYRTDDAVMDEWVADFLGARFGESEFWDAVAREAESTGGSQDFRDFASYARQWVENLARKVNKVFTRFAHWRNVTGIDKIRGTLANVLAKYEAEGPYSNDPSFSEAQGRHDILGTPPVQVSARQRAIGGKVTGTLEDKRALMQKASDYLADLGDFIQRELQQKLLDRFTAIKRLERATIGTNEIDAANSAYKWTRLTGNLAGVMDYMLRHGRLAYQNGSMVMQPGTKGLIEILRPVVEMGGLQPWEWYVAAYRANRLLDEGREKNFGKYQDPQTGEWQWDQARAQDEINELLKLGKQYPEFETARKEYVEFQKSILDLAEASGLIDPSTRPIWERGDYVPFYRIVEALDDRDVHRPMRRRGFSGQTAGIRQLKGGPQRVAILENIFRNMEQLVDASFKNIAAQRIADLARDDSNLLVQIPFKSVPFSATVGETIAKLEAADVDTAALAEGDLDAVVKFWRARAPQGSDIFVVMYRGKPAFFRVKDKPLLRSILAMGPDRYAWWMRMLMIPKRGLTTLVTLSPEFMAANTIRDTLHAWVIADTPIKPGWDSMRGFVKSLKEDPVMLGVMAGGGGTGHYNRMEESEVRRAFLRMTREQRSDFLGSIIDTPAKLFRLYRDLGRASENANRLAIADSVLKRGGSPAEAAFQALDIMDFGLRGDSKLLTFFLDTVPFLNARIQGLYRLGRGLMNDPKRVATHGAIIVGATMALLAKNWDDDRWNELQEWDKDLYYHLWIGGRHIRIPKPFEVGQIFSTFPERLMQFMAKDGDSRLFARRMLAMVGETFNMNPTPQALKPLLERAMNKNFLTGGRIISKGDEFKPAPEQYSAFTSETAREVAEAMPDGAPEWLRSPKTLEFLIRGYFGTIGLYALDASDAIVRAAADYPEQPASKPGDFWMARRFSPESDLKQNKYVSEFYDLHNDITEIVNRVRDLRERGEAEEAANIIEEKRDLLGHYPRTKATAATLTQLRAQERDVYENPRGRTPEERRQELARISAQRNRYAREAVLAAPNRPRIYNPFATR